MGVSRGGGWERICWVIGRGVLREDGPEVYILCSLRMRPPFESGENEDRK